MTTSTKEACFICGGAGKKEVYADCEACGGSGWAPGPNPWGPDASSWTAPQCDVCGGSGKAEYKVKAICDNCGGSGVSPH